MSKDEAIKVLTRMIDVGIEYDGGYGIEELGYDEEDACKMAIKALEQDGDCISRQAVLESLHSKFVDGFDADRWWNSISVLYAINKVPSVTQEQKTGHWECNELFYNGESRGAIIRCSKCGNEFKVSPKVFESLYDNERFCNHCGAKMEVEKEHTVT